MNRVKWNIISVFGLRGYKKRMLPVIIFNRILHHFHKHVCAFCYKLVGFESCYGVINDDCLACPECFERIVS